MPRWLSLSILTVLFWGVWGFLSRVLGSALTGEETLVISTIGLIPIILWLATRPSRKESVHRACVAWAALGGFVSNAGNLALYQLMNAGEKAATTVPLTAMYPVLTILLAMVFLRERLSGCQWLGIFLSLVAIYCFNFTAGQAGLNRWLLLALVPMALWGVSAFLQKLSTRQLSGECSTLWFLIGLLPIAVWFACTSGVRPGLGSKTLGLGLVSGFLLGLGNLTLLAAYASQGKASIITPLSSLYPMVTVLMAVLFLRERVQGFEALGILLSLSAVVLLSFEKRASSATQPPA